MRNKTMLMFVYGTLKRGRGNNIVMGKSKFITNATTKDKFALYQSGIPYMSSLEQIHNVKGELWEVDIEKDLPSIDILEGYSPNRTREYNFYTRTPIQVIGEDGVTYDCETYICDVLENNKQHLTLTDGEFN